MRARLASVLLACLGVTSFASHAQGREPGRRIGEPTEQVEAIAADANAVALRDGARVRVVDLRHGRVSTWQDVAPGTQLRLAEDGGTLVLLEAAAGRLIRTLPFDRSREDGVTPVRPGAFDLAIDAGAGRAALTTTQREPPPGPKQPEAAPAGYACVHLLVLGGPRTLQRCVVRPDGAPVASAENQRLALARDGSRVWWWSDDRLRLLDGSNLAVLAELPLPAVARATMTPGERPWWLEIRTEREAFSISAADRAGLRANRTALPRGAALARDVAGRRRLGFGWALLREEATGPEVALMPAAGFELPAAPRWQLTEQGAWGTVQLAELLVVVRAEPTFWIAGLLPTVRRNGAVFAHAARLIWRGADNALRTAPWTELDAIGTPTAGLDVVAAARETVVRLFDAVASTR